jgi:CheY-like chemotaxis protein
MVKRQTILIVDDDPHITRRWAKEFAQNTNLKPVEATSLRNAWEIMASRGYDIDAVIADLFFDADSQDPAHDLYDGIDLLRFINLRHPSIPLFVISASADMANYKSKAASLKVPVNEYFDKLMTADPREPAWKKIERQLFDDNVTASFQTPPAILEKLRTQRCIAFVGAGFSAVVGMPSWASLLRSLLEFARRHNRDSRTASQCEDAINNEEFGVAASVIKDLLEDSEILELIHVLYGRQVLNRAPIDLRGRMLRRMDALAHISWSGIITTNYDNLIEIAISQGSGSWTVAEDHSRQLGTILAQPDMSERFFVKLHGSLSSSNFVLSTRDYNDVYLKSRKISNFLKAIMLKYHLVFIGCSLEDHVIDIRKQLAADYDGNIPMSYALMPATRRNVLRSATLRKESAIDIIFYPDGKFDCVDKFLIECSVSCSMAP